MTTVSTERHPTALRFLDDPSPASIEAVGGKALSLIRLTAAGFSVPSGAVLTTAFFAPWFEWVHASPAGARFAAASPEERGALCDELQEVARGATLDPAQREILDRAAERLGPLSPSGLFAVRSSAVDEDGAGASFAGGYATRLGVPLAGLEEAVRESFVSSFDERVVTYRDRLAADGDDEPASRLVAPTPGFAVVVQVQLDSEIAGVGFSIDPQTNDFDHAVVDANWGQGESVVAGLASPDHFVVDKVTGEIVERRLGAKEAVVRLGVEGVALDKSGGTERSDGDWTLDTAQLAEVVESLVAIERLWGVPVDVEWALADGALHILQARPVTAFVPLPPEMLTAPGERRRLYADIALSGGLTINAPISPMGLDWMEETLGMLAARYLGLETARFAEPQSIDDRLWFCAGGRMYQNLSSLLYLARPETLARGNESADARMAAILASIDRERYAAPSRPAWLGLGAICTVPKALWRLRRALRRTLGTVLRPERARRLYEQRVAVFEARFEPERIARETADQPFGVMRRDLGEEAMRHVLEVAMPALAASLAALALLDALVRPLVRDAPELAASLQRGFPGNVATKMGIALHRLAQGRTAGEPLDSGTAWDAFVAAYGWRGPLEMDLASPRYADDSSLALGQIESMRVGEDRFDPERSQQRLLAERRAAYSALRRRSGPLRRWLLRRLYRVVDRFAQVRDTPKHHNLMLYAAVRRRALREGAHLVETGRLDRADDVFDLKFHDLEAAGLDPSLDLRALCEERSRFGRRLARQVRQFPAVIDSRGRILRPPRGADRPGEWLGMPVSPGIARGPVKRLHSPDEKPIEPGEILVAYTTDPGWTPLFATAGAVVLEVGGMLQHGAVVAREFGKPCVVGIDRSMEIFRDGDLVEVDGGAGVVRRLGVDGRNRDAER